MKWNKGGDGDEDDDKEQMDDYNFYEELRRLKAKELTLEIMMMNSTWLTPTTSIRRRWASDQKFSRDKLDST